MPSLETFRAFVVAELSTSGSVIVHDRYQNYDSAELGPLVVHQLCCAHYADLRIMPILSRLVLVGGGER